MKFIFGLVLLCLHLYFTSAEEQHSATEADPAPVTTVAPPATTAAYSEQHSATEADPAPITTVAPPATTAAYSVYPAVPRPYRNWTLLFRQTLNGKDELFKKNEWSRNKQDIEAPNFSRLEDFESFRKPDGKFHLFLWYPELGMGNEWTQTSNPVNKTSGGVDNYQAIAISSTEQGWGGLEYNAWGGSLLDGSVNQRSWWYAIGASRLHNSGIPGPSTKVVKVVELYINYEGKGNVKLVDDRPYLMTGSTWRPICGHAFWNNNVGASIVCKKLGYPQGVGVVEAERKSYDEEPFYVGLCNSNKITDLENGCSKPKLFAPNNCEKGRPVSIKIKCKGFTYSMLYNPMKRIVDNPTIVMDTPSKYTHIIKGFIDLLQDLGKDVIDTEIFKSLIKPLFLQIVKNPSLDPYFPDFSSLFHCKILPSLIQNEDSNSPLFQSKVVLNAKFPQKVNESVQTQKGEVTIDGNHTDTCRFKYCFNHIWISTGFYAKQGELITLTVPKHVIGKFKIMISAYTHNIYGSNTILRSFNRERQRPACLTQDYEKNLIKRETRLLSGYGGYIYVVIDGPIQLGKFTLKFDKIIKSPTFVYGKTTKEEWEEMFASSKSPQVEIQTSGLTVTIAKEDVVKRNFNIPMLGKQFEQVMQGISELLGFTLPSPVSRRYLYSDKDIGCRDAKSGHKSCGGIAGYPCMDGMYLYELGDLSNGGMRILTHELGHTFQLDSWTPDGNLDISLGEASNDIFTLYVNEEIFKKGYISLNLPSLRYANKKFPEWDGYSWGKLNVFQMIKQECHWETFKQFFKYYNELPRDQEPSTITEKYVTMAKVLSQKCNKNLIPFLQWWDFGGPGEETRAGLAVLGETLKNLPKWEGIIETLDTAQRRNLNCIGSHCWSEHTKTFSCRSMGDKAWSSIETCEKYCQNHPVHPCIAVNYNAGYGGGYCVFKYCDPPMPSPTDAIEGYKGYYLKGCRKENGTDTYSYIMGSKKMDTDQDCANWCGVTNGCTFWTWREEDKLCWIKRGDLYTIRRAGYISGEKRCASEETVEAVSSSTYSDNLDNWGPQCAIDGLISSENTQFFHSKSEDYPWLQIRLKTARKITHLTLVNRKNCCFDRLKNAEIRAGMEGVQEGTKNQLLTINTVCVTYKGPPSTKDDIHLRCETPIKANFITIQLKDKNAVLQINEFVINGGTGDTNNEMDFHLKG